MSRPPLHAFEGVGIELEYMIVDRDALAVRPLADQVLAQAAGKPVCDVTRGELGWSNELVLHQIELKNLRPSATLVPLAAAFRGELQCIGELLAPSCARLMPTGMHPWMDPRGETHLWPHQNAQIYATYDRLFDCRQGHGWANLQSMHVNLPFAGDAEFARLHAAIRLVLPLLPALAASSPIAEATPTGFLDFRMEAYRSNARHLRSIAGDVIPDTVDSETAYRSGVLAPMYRDIAPLDPAGVLQHEWLNSRGAIPRFERSAIEIRVIDMQECPEADLAVAAATVSLVEALYEARWSTLDAQQRFDTARLARLLSATIRDAEQALIDDADYLQLLGLSPRRRRAGELWQHLAETALPAPVAQHPALQTILTHGPLARRILRTLGGEPDADALHAVYQSLCDCLDQGRMF